MLVLKAIVLLIAMVILGGVSLWLIGVTFGDDRFNPHAPWILFVLMGIFWAAAYKVFKYLLWIM